MADNLTRTDLMQALVRIDAGLADASYRVGKLRQGNRTSRDLAAVSINLEGARSDLVALMQLLGRWDDDGPLPSD
jgi:hypothetical protein